MFPTEFSASAIVGAHEVLNKWLFGLTEGQVDGRMNEWTNRIWIRWMGGWEKEWVERRKKERKREREKADE